MCEFDACERDMAILRAHAPFVSPPPVRPSLLPAWLERRVRHALRLPALPAARAGLLQLHDTPYHAHALSTRPPCTSYTTGRRRCPSSTRAPTGTTTIFSGDTPERSPRAPARTRTPHRGCATPTDASIPRPFHNPIHRFPRLPPQPKLPFAPLPACAALAVAVLHRQPRATTTETAPLRFPGLSLTQEHLHTPDALPSHTGSQARSATGMCSARRRPHLKHQEAIVAGARRPSAAQLPVRPPCGTSHRLSCASSVPASLERGVRHPPRYEPPATRLRHHPMRAIVLPTRRDTLDTMPGRTPARIHTASPVAQREYAAHHQRTQHTLQLFPITHTLSSRPRVHPPSAA
ncbi:hypothetical protein B0H14DRAFT_1339373 [Mycena olivaceomarginata]|nr:hypothetical protein B0H14DRAFT_1339373 [Mycena olivaceomarginata]